MSQLTPRPLYQEEGVGKIQTAERVTWTIENFSRYTNNKKLYSNPFVFRGYKWRMLMFPKGNNVDYLSIYLAVADSLALPCGWRRHAQFSLAVINQKNNKLTLTKDTTHEFHAMGGDWGFAYFMPVRVLYDLRKGFLMNDSCIIEADITVLEKEVNTPKRKRDQSVEYGENLVGSRIKIWWPEDKSYYCGVIKSFNSIRKKHKLLYDSGEEELLNLKTEKWEYVENVSPESNGMKPCLEEKVSSPESDVICVQGYNVKNNIAPTLEAIFKKHGDIAAECLFKPASTRSSLLESVCEVVKRIETSDFTAIVSEMEEIESQVSALKATKINVSWLQTHLESIRKRKEAKKNSILLTETKGTTVLVKIAAQMDLNERSAKLRAAQEEFEKAERCVIVLDLVEKKLSSNILEAKAEKDSWVDHKITSLYSAS